MVKLYILGSAEIRNRAGELEHSFLAGPKRLGLLAYLLLSSAEGFIRRDNLLPLFWPEQGQKSARNSLSNILYHIRHTIGNESIVNRGREELIIRSDVFWSDVLQFQTYYAHQEYSNAIALYRGDLLRGFHISGASSEFDKWLESKRSKFQTVAVKSAWALSKQAEKEQNFSVAQRWAKQAVGFDPLHEQNQVRFLELLYRTGDPQAAVLAYQKFADRYRREWDTAPPFDLSTLSKDINSHQKPIVSPASVDTSNTIFPQNRDRQPERIAVLPFESLGEKQPTVLSDAIHADILTKLSDISDLRVISRTSVLQFRNSKLLLPQIAQSLGVDWILGGEVLENSDMVQIHTRLYNAQDDAQIWAQSYHKHLTTDNIFHIQTEVAKNISKSLHARLSQAEEAAMQQNQAKDLEAYFLQAKGRQSFDKRTEARMREAIDFFRQAIVHDPEYALAWVGLADTLILFHDYGYATRDDVMPEAKKATQKAIELAKDSAEANTTLALLYGIMGKHREALNQLKKAIALRPSYADAHNWLSWGQQLSGAPQLALQSAQTAATLNPLFAEALINLGLSYLINHQYQLSIQQARKMKSMEADWATSSLIEGTALYHLGRYQDAIRILKDVSVPWSGSGPLVTSALAYWRLGNDHELNRIKTQFTKDDNYLGMAILHAANHQIDQAFQLWGKFRDRDYWTIYSLRYLYPEILAPIRTDRRFEGLLAKINAVWPPTDDIVHSN